MGRLRANFARLGNPMQDCHLRKEPYVTGMPLVSPFDAKRFGAPQGSAQGKKPALCAYLPASRVILSRRRRISVRVDSDSH